MWFTRIQQPLVIGAWYASQGVGIGLGGLIGYGIGQIEASIAAWRYEFIIIGMGCALWGIAMAFIIPDSPYTSKRFTRQEKVVIMSRKRDDYHAVEKRQLKWDQVSGLGLARRDTNGTDQRVSPRPKDIPLLPARSHRQYSERRNLQLWHSDDPRLWLQHAQHHALANPLRAQSDTVHVSDKFCHSNAHSPQLRLHLDQP